MLKRWVSMLLAVFTAGCFIGSNLVWADEIDDAKGQKRKLDDDLWHAKKRLEEAKRRADKAGDDLHNTVVKLNALQNRSVELKKREGVLKTSIEDNQAQLKKKREQFSQRKEIYLKRLKEIYISGSVNYIDVLLGSGDFGDFVDRMYLLEKIMVKDRNMLQEISTTVEDIQSRTQRQTKELGEIKETRQQISKAENEMGETREKRRRLLEAAKKEEQDEENKYDQLLETSERIAKMLKEMEKNNPQRFEDRADNFIWPCYGPITSYFGWRIHPLQNKKKYHNGMDIGVDYYTEIRAANRGTVTYAGWMNGYGNVVMIDHGESLVSLYAHNDSVKCKEGDFVKQGQVIALAGATGYATGPHLHFEVRLHGDVADPLIYIKEEDNKY